MSSSREQEPAGKTGGNRHPRVSVIILNWQNYDGCRQLLLSIDGLTYGNLDTVVVDNGSPDGSGERLADEFPDIGYLGLEKNAGYAAGNNAGVRLALERGADFLFILNFDIEIITAGIIERMVECFERLPFMGILNPFILYVDRPSNRKSSHIRQGPYFRAIRRMITPDPDLLPPSDQKGILEERPFAYGCAMMVSRECLERVGYLNEEFFMYGVELEFCFRAKRRGFSTMAFIGDGATVLHRGGNEPKPWKAFFDARNQFLFLKLFSRSQQVLLLAVFTGSLLENTALFLMRGEPRQALDSFSGFLEGLRIWAADITGHSRPGEHPSREKEKFQLMREKYSRLKQQ
jgi:GT2 family glycosyltransferase